MQISEAILTRVSNRTFLKRPLDEDQLLKIDELLSGNLILPFSPKVRFKWLYSHEAQDIDFKKFGTYGFVKNCPAFIVLAVEKGPYALENVGFAGEKIILELTAMGLASCWLGGSFRRSQFSSAIQLNENEILPAVIAVGHAAERRSLVDRAIIWSAKSRTRLPLDQLFYCSDNQELSELQMKLLHFIQAAPSASNKQPWRVMIEGNRFHFFVAPDAKYQKTLAAAKLADLQRVDMGIALSHLILSAEEAQLSPHILVLTETVSPNSSWNYILSVEF